MTTNPSTAGDLSAAKNDGSPPLNIGGGGDGIGLGLGPGKGLMIGFGDDFTILFGFSRTNTSGLPHIRLTVLAICGPPLCGRTAPRVMDLARVGYDVNDIAIIKLILIMQIIWCLSCHH
jgi:hypothetical protein